MGGRAIDEGHRSIEVGVVGRGEVTGLEKGLLAFAIGRRHGVRARGVILVQQHHLHRVEALGRAIREVAFLFRLGEVHQGQPGRLALEQERSSTLVD